MGSGITGCLLMLCTCLPLAGMAQRPVTGGGNPAVSPDGRRIAFGSDRSGTSQIYTIGIDGTDEAQATHTPDTKVVVAWLPNGQLYCSKFAHDTIRLFALGHADTIRQVGVFPGRMASLSPNGARVVYSAGSWSANKVIVSDLDGGHARQITDSSSIAWNMRWSPDGAQIAFTGRAAETGDLAVFIMNADGSGRRQVTHIGREHGLAQLPAWSPDGRQLAVQTSDTNHTGSIWVVDVGTGAARELGAHAARYVDEVPSWFPDGKRIAFQSDRTGRMEIWMMNADGTGVSQVTGQSLRPPPG